jgi:hypothetical protein
MQARELRRLILGDDSEFWQSCANYCTIMKATVAALKEFDGKQPCMGNVYMMEFYGGEGSASFVVVYK